MSKKRIKNKKELFLFDKIFEMNIEFAQFKEERNDFGEHIFYGKCKEEPSQGILIHGSKARVLWQIIFVLIGIVLVLN